MTASFFNACRVLWQNGETRFSLMGTSMFWGAGGHAALPAGAVGAHGAGHYR
ncbi:Lysophospholipid transporter lplT [Leclercia adecarboxylata]|uniref:Lysophospholipid transporter lplT n=1 Tax=Leclercia adecarboxylata TaxID=83655 RepID=A0A4U9IJU1_9ENTR|nr:Lysophospholipid transporter lplT [Leclercia adecarboxylata]